MIPHTVQELAALKDAPRVFYALQFSIGLSTYRFCTADTEKSVFLNAYMPGFIDEMDEIEITAQPRTNDQTVVMSDPELIFTSLLLGGGYMNKPFVIYKVIEDRNGSTIKVKNAFEGFISDYVIDVDSSTVELIASSVWADFEKTSGIKTNPKSQQRFYPLDTAFEHAAYARDKIYWGKDAPGFGRTDGGGGTGGSNYETPKLNIE